MLTPAVTQAIFHPDFACLGGEPTRTLPRSILNSLKDVKTALACIPLLDSRTDSWSLHDMKSLYAVGEPQVLLGTLNLCWSGAMNESALPSGMVSTAPLSSAELNPAPAHRVAALCRSPAAAALSTLLLWFLGGFAERLNLIIFIWLFSSLIQKVVMHSS